MELTLAQHLWAKTAIALCSLTWRKCLYVCMITLGCSTGQGLSTYILSTPFKQGLRNAASRQPHQALEGSGDHWWQSNNTKKYGSPQSIFHPHAVGHLLHKGLVLWLTYLETEVAVSLPFPEPPRLPGNRAQSTWIAHPTWETVAILIHRKMALTMASVCWSALGG